MSAYKNVSKSQDLPHDGQVFNEWIIIYKIHTFLWNIIVQAHGVRPFCGLTEFVKKFINQQIGCITEK